ncbi:phosphoribosylformimino-5-aminoimidazole carboxamide ribotide isomerase [Batrachochytrium salamandrivorans]|nr:phosphoribosylformimino-5-aminoimidazole carboxamide ribotide isomerase [Batrachochytrium salamandrivorans]
MKFRPCIDLHSGKVKQIVGSSLTETGAGPQTNFETDLASSYFAQLYRDAKMFGGHVIMLGPGNEEAAIGALKAFPGGLQVGGGITNLNCQHYLEQGASHVIVTSHVFSNGKVDFDKLKALVQLTTKQKLVLDLSCRKKPNSGDTYFVVTDRWEKFTDFAVNKENLQLLSEYCDEFLVHAVDVEGKREGMLLDLVVNLGEWSPIPVTYAGGARSLEDLELAHRLGKGRVDITIGSALDIFGGELSFQKICEFDQRQVLLQEVVDFVQCSSSKDMSMQDVVNKFDSMDQAMINQTMELGVNRGVLVRGKNGKYKTG